MSGVGGMATLPPGCQCRWCHHPAGEQSDLAVTQTVERSFFPFGSQGGIPEEHCATGSSWLSNFLEAEGSKHGRRETPVATGSLSDGESGFDPAIGAELD